MFTSCYLRYAADVSEKCLLPAIFVMLLNVSEKSNANTHVIEV